MITGLIIIASVLLLDQVTKAIIWHTIQKSGQTVIVIKNLLNFEYTLNENISFSIEVPSVVILIVSLIAMAIFIYLFKFVDFKKAKVYSISVSLFIAGSLGNAIDRILHGGVVDFIHHPFLGDIHHILGFIYNFADLALNVAVVLFVIDLFFFESKRKKAHEANASV